jgi:hypothetical protein
MTDLSQESPLWREWAESRHSVQQMREELDRLRAENARLIAAEPELVEALRTARDYVFNELETERQQMKGYERISRIDEIASDLARIDAALAKAGVL